MITWSQEIDEILNRGVSLHGQGTNNWALDFDAAFQALESLNTLEIAILGGDVYRLSGGKLSATYDNWHCDKNESESPLEYRSRSIEQAKQYLRIFSGQSDVYFALVPAIVRPIDADDNLSTNQAP